MVNIIRGKKAAEALNILLLHNSGAAAPLKKLLLSAVANVKHNLNENVEEFSLTRVEVNEAARMKRIKYRARGRADRIVKRSCHVTIELSN